MTCRDLHVISADEAAIVQGVDAGRSITATVKNSKVLALSYADSATEPDATWTVGWDMPLDAGAKSAFLEPAVVVKRASNGAEREFRGRSAKTTPLDAALIFDAKAGTFELRRVAAAATRMCCSSTVHSQTRSAA